MHLILCLLTLLLFSTQVNASFRAEVSAVQKRVQRELNGLETVLKKYRDINDAKLLETTLSREYPEFAIGTLSKADKETLEKLQRQLKEHLDLLEKKIPHPLLREMRRTYANGTGLRFPADLPEKLNVLIVGSGPNGGNASLVIHPRVANVSVLERYPKELSAVRTSNFQISNPGALALLGKHGREFLFGSTEAAPVSTGQGFRVSAGSYQEALKQEAYRRSKVAVSYEKPVSRELLKRDGVDLVVDATGGRLKLAEDTRIDLGDRYKSKGVAIKGYSVTSEGYPKPTNQETLWMGAPGAGIRVISGPSSQMRHVVKNEIKLLKKEGGSADSIRDLERIAAYRGGVRYVDFNLPYEYFKFMYPGRPPRTIRLATGERIPVHNYEVFSIEASLDAVPLLSATDAHPMLAKLGTAKANPFGAQEITSSFENIENLGQLTQGLAILKNLKPHLDETDAKGLEDIISQIFKVRANRAAMTLTYNNVIHTRFWQQHASPKIRSRL